jgi:hypothetical protein
MEPPTPAVVQEFPSGNILTPIDDSIRVRTERVRNGERIAWTSGSWRGKVYYRVYRSDQPRTDVSCQLSSGSWSCYLRTKPVHTTTTATSWVDPSPVEGVVYRVGVGTNWRADPSLGDVFAISPPVPAAR